LLQVFAEFFGGAETRAGVVQLLASLLRLAEGAGSRDLLLRSLRCKLYALEEFATVKSLKPYSDRLFLESLLRLSLYSESLPMLRAVGALFESMLNLGDF
jgi:hypothetical protein